MKTDSSFLETSSYFSSSFPQDAEEFCRRDSCFWTLLLDTWWAATGVSFQWCQCVTLPKMDREKVWANHVHNWISEKPGTWERRAISMRKVCSVGNFFPTLLIFLSSLDSPPPPLSLFNGPICEQTQDLGLILCIAPLSERRNEAKQKRCRVIIDVFKT